MSSALEWPSLTVEWLPDREQPDGKDYSIQRLLLGTHTSGGEAGAPPPTNYLMLAEVRLPTGAKPSAAATKDEDEEDEGAYGAHSGKLEIIQRIVHAGEVNRARYAPHNPNLIATKSPSDRVYLFDKTRHASTPTDATFRPDLVLAGHEGEGYGLAWNPHAACAGQLLSGSDDTLICMWDVEASSREHKKSGSAGAVPPLHVFRGHKDVVEDVAWSHFTPSMFASAGDDAKLLLWDTRTPGKPSATINDGPANKSAGHHTANINCVSFNHLSAHLLASGSSDKLVNLWDLRRLHAPIHALQGHTDEVFTVSFAPFSPDILASCGADRRTFIWDLSRIGDQPMQGDQAEEDAEDGPPELLFVHGGHTDKVADISWNTNVGEEWMMASVSDDNVLQVWQSQCRTTTTAPARARAQSHDVHESTSARPRICPIVLDSTSNAYGYSWSRFDDASILLARPSFVQASHTCFLLRFLCVLVVSQCPTRSMPMMRRPQLARLVRVVS
jgi:histone-binding protein RBBP4